LSIVTLMPVLDMSGGWSASHGLQSSQGAPAPQSQASNRLLNILKGRSGWFSQTQPVLSQVTHVIAPAPGDMTQCGGGAGVPSQLARAPGHSQGCRLFFGAIHSLAGCAISSYSSAIRVWLSSSFPLPRLRTFSNRPYDENYDDCPDEPGNQVAEPIGPNETPI
jgi:hypothetical protein